MTPSPWGLPLVALSYLQFHLVFVIPPLVALAALTRFPAPDRRRAEPVGITLLVVVAVVYTTPWDNHLIASGVWAYAPGAVRFRLWHAPIEEYAFFVLQPLLTGLWLCRLPTRTDHEFGIGVGKRVLGVVAGVLVAIAGWLLLADATYYLGALLAWAGPVLALQWGFGWPVLWDRRRSVAIGVAVPTVYLAAADRIAIAVGIWRFDPAYMTSLAVFGLPVEELLFFTLTNLFVVQGLVLFWWVTDRWPQVQALYSHTKERSGV